MSLLRAASSNPRVGMRILAFALLVAGVVMAIVPWLYSHLLPLGRDESLRTWHQFFVFIPSLVFLLALTLSYGLRKMPSPIRVDPDARGRVLALPLHLALVTLFIGEVAVIGTLVHDGYTTATSPQTLIGMALVSSACVALVVVPLAAYARFQLTPLALRLGDESRPLGPRLSLRIRLGYTIAVVALAAVIPAAVFGVEAIDSATLEDARDRATATAYRLVAASEDLEVAQATSLLTRAPLEDGVRIVFRAASGMLLPEDTALELAGQPFVELPLQGALRGAHIRAVYSAPTADRLPLFVALVVMLTVAFVLSRALANGVALDAANIAKQIERVASDKPPEALVVGTTAEIRRVALAVNRLLERIPRLTIESYIAVERANEARRMKSQFLANMSHDLRAPLNSILGFSELLLRGLEGPISPGQRITLAAIHSTGLRLLRQLSEILDTAKAESGKMELHRKLTPPVELITQAVNEAKRGRSSEFNDRMRIELQPGLGPVHVDPLRLQQAVTHLVGYGMDESKNGPITLRVTERDGERARMFVLELDFEGYLDDADQAQLFNAFRSIPGKAGLNLALPLAKRLFELHGGVLEVTPGVIPRFHVELPVGTRRA